jgi:L-threonylcarbamoyladenylate synthase
VVAPLTSEVGEAVEVLRRGGLVAFPTETVYGLGADAENEAALRRVFEVKGRPTGHPLIVHLGAAGQLDEWASDPPGSARVLAGAFWPGPLTMLVRRSPRVPDLVTGGRPSVGLRVPDQPLALRLLAEFGGGVAAPSANRFGHVSPTTAAHVQADLGDGIDLILDGGPCRIGVESTIVDLTQDHPEVIRPGGIPVAELEAVLGSPLGVWAGEREVSAPGTLAAHYSPATPVELANAAEVAARAAAAIGEGRRVGVLAPIHLDDVGDDVIQLEPAGPSGHYAHVLYRRLRQADHLGLDLLLVVPPPADELGLAVRDRLRRAAHG